MLSLKKSLPLSMAFPAWSKYLIWDTVSPGRVAASPRISSRLMISFSLFTKETKRVVGIWVLDPDTLQLLVPTSSGDRSPLSYVPI